MATSLRAFFALSGLILLAAAPISAFRYLEEKGEVGRAWEIAGIAERHPEVRDSIRHDPDPKAAFLRVARAVLADSIDARWLADLPPREAAAEAEAFPDRLESVRRIAREVARRRPASGEAFLVLGGLAFVEAWRSDELDLVESRQRWEDRLRRAAVLAPAEDETDRLRATAALTLWHVLSEAERRETVSLLERAFRDESTLDRLLPAWLVVAPDDATLEAPLPSSPRPWSALQRHRAREGDWEGLCRARERWREENVRRVAEVVEEADARLAGGDLRGARRLYLQVAGTLSPDRGVVDLFSHAIVSVPPGPVPPGVVDALAEWLRWGTALWLVDRPSLPKEAFARLSGLVGHTAPALAGVGALAAGDLQRAEGYERRTDRLWSEEWAPYLLAKTRVLSGRGAEREARTLLEEVHSSWRRTWAYRLALESLDARPDESAPPAEHWRWQGGTPRLALDTPPGRHTASVELLEVPSRGTAVEPSIDGQVTGCVPVPTEGELELTLSGGGVHLLGLRSVPPGKEPTPGRVVVTGAGSDDGA